MIDFESEHVRLDNRHSTVQEDLFSSEKFLLVLKKHWIWIPLSLILASVTAYFYLKYSKPLYNASSLIKLEFQKEASKVGLAPSLSYQTENLEGEIELIKSQRVASELTSFIDLNVSYFAVGNIITTEIYKSSPFSVSVYSDPVNNVYDQEFRVVFVNDYQFKLLDFSTREPIGNIHKIGDEIQLGNFRFSLQWTSVKENDIEGKEYLFRLNSKGALINYLLSNVMVQASSTEARTLTISFNDYNREKAIDIVNAYDTIYLKQSIEKKQKSHEQTLAFIRTQIDETATKLEDYEDEMKLFVKKTGSISPSTEFSEIAKEMGELEKNRIELTRSAKKYDEILGFVKSDASKENIVPLMFGLENIQMAEGLNKLNELYRQREMLRLSNKDVTMPYRKIELEISFIKSQLLNIISESRKYLNEQQAEINSTLGKLSAQFSGLPDKETELNRLKRFNNLYEKYYLNLIEKQIEYQISKAGTVPEFTILSEAYASTVPVSPNRQKVWMLFLLVGFLPPSLFILIRYLMMNVIYSQQQIESKLLAPILGAVPSNRKKMAASTLVVDKNPKSSVSEAMRTIRTNSDFMLPKKTKYIIGVTSTISGEGKTFFAINYAGILALTGKKVVILDLDMRKPKIHVGFNVDNNVGMSSILSGLASWQDAVKHSTLQNLDLIPAGPIPPNPNELLLKKEFDELIDSLFLKYDVIMADNPPIGLVTDASNVFRRCDLSIYVVRSGYSKENVIHNINALYKSKNYTNLSVIINDVNKKNTYGSKYGYGYGYGYGYYEDDGDKKNWFQKIFSKK